MKKTVLLFLTVAVVLSMLAAPAASGEAAPIAIGYTSALVTPMNLSNVQDIKDYTGAYVSVKITDVEGLKRLADIVGGRVNGIEGGRALFSGQTVYLANDLDLSAVSNFAPIGENVTDKVFKGTFNGMGHTISNLTINLEGKYVGLFRCTNGATIKNLILADTCTISGTTFNDENGTEIKPTVGGIVGYAAKTTTLSNCYSKATVNGVLAAGGLVGESAVEAVKLEYCSFGGSAYATTVGGMVGKGGAVLRYCRNLGLIQGMYAGGIFGYSTLSGTEIDTCINNGEIKCDYTAYAAGIVARIKAIGSMTNCINYGTQAPINPNHINAVHLSQLVGKLDNGVEFTPDASNLERSGEEDESLTAGPALPELPEDWVAPDEAIGYDPALVVHRSDLSKVANILDFSKYNAEYEYKITNAEGLVYLAQLVENWAHFSGVTIYLANDIDMSGVTDFKPIGNEVSGGMNHNSPTCYFSGVFDGQGNIIENLVIQSDDAADDVKDNFVALALFGLNKNLTVKNLILGEGCSVTYTGGSGNSCVAGIAARVYGTTVIENCYSAATISNPSGFTGGIVCRSTGTLNLTNCTNAGDVMGGGHSGGMAAYSGNINLIRCRNTGIVSGTIYVAGICARVPGADPAPQIVINSCYNNGSIEGSQASAIASFLGGAYSMTDCVNFGVVLVSSSEADPFVADVNSYAGGDVVKENNYHVPRGENPTLKVIDLTTDFTPMADEFVPTVNNSVPTDTKEPSAENEPSSSQTETNEDSADDTDGTKKKFFGCGSVSNEWGVLMLLAVCVCLLQHKKRSKV